jgi:CDP-diacylglycerol pyrophosphatase
MNAGPFHLTKHGKSGGGLAIFRLSSLIATAICACAPFVSHATNAAQGDLPRSALWEIVSNICVPGQSQNHDPKPCLRVDLAGGIEGGFAILRDPRGGTQFLLVPTARIVGIESPIIRGPHATNYFADAWEARTYLNDALHQTLPRADIGLAINSALSRSQDQLHIHFSCIRTDVLNALRKNEGSIGAQWTLLNGPLLRHSYMAMWVAGENLEPHNPFTLLAEGLPDATRDMGNRTLVVVGLTRRDGTKGFDILTDRVNEHSGDLANGEELLDHACHIAAMGKQAQFGLSEPEIK